MSSPKHIKQIYEEMKGESTKKIIRVLPIRDKRIVGEKMREVPA